MKETSEAPVSAGEIDADVAERVWLLLDSKGRGYRSIKVEANAGTVKLSGSVATYFLRQMAVSLAGQAEGVRQVEDGLQVMLGGSTHPARKEA